MRATATRITALLLAAALALLVPGGVASAAPATSCVGLVVDTGTKVSTACVPYTAKLTGQALLQKAGHQLTFDKSGLLCQIDGYPSACRSDAKHYWGYYLRKPGGVKWGYAKTGPVQDKAQPKGTEGWAYIDGPNRQPKAVAYASLAKTTAKKAVATTKKDDGGTPWAVIIGIVVVVLLVAAGLWQVLLRRRSPSS